MSRVSHAAFLLLASLTLAAAQPRVVTDVDFSPSTERPDGLVGQWIGRYVAAGDALQQAEGATALFSAHEGVVEHVGVIFDPTVMVFGSLNAAFGCMAPPNVDSANVS